MRIAVLSDIHGNAVALQAVLDDLAARPVDRIVNLGDAIQGGPQPSEVCARLREQAIPTVMGNADAWLLSGIETDAESIPADRRLRLNEVRAWSLTRLSEADRRTIEAFPALIDIELEGGGTLRCFHGTPASFDEMILPGTSRDALERMLGPHRGRFLCGGHTHVQQVHHLGRTFYFNPGSVGLAYRHDQEPGGFRCDPWAEYAVLASEGAHLAVEFHRVPIDVDALIHAYRTSGRPDAASAIGQYRGEGAGGVR